MHFLLDFCSKICYNTQYKGAETLVRLKNQPESKHFVDETGYVDPYVFEFQPHNSLTGHPPVAPPRIPWHDLDEHEKSLVNKYGFSPDDIFLMRIFKTNPSQIMKGWNLQPNMGE